MAALGELGIFCAQVFRPTDEAKPQQTLVEIWVPKQRWSLVEQVILDMPNVELAWLPYRFSTGTGKVLPKVKWPPIGDAGKSNPFSYWPNSSETTAPTQEFEELWKNLDEWQVQAYVMNSGVLDFDASWFLPADTPSTISIDRRALAMKKTRNYFSNRYRHNCVIAPSGKWALEVSLKGARGIVLEGGNYWETLDVFIVATESQLYFSLDGFYAASSGNRPPPITTYVSMKPKYAAALNQYINRLKSELSLEFGRN